MSNFNLSHISKSDCHSTPKKAVYDELDAELEKNDPRIGFIEVVKKLEAVSGYNTLHVLEDKEALYPSTRLQYGRFNSLYPPDWLKEGSQ